MKFEKCPQAVQLIEEKSFDQNRYALMICGIRPVKDPLKAIEGWKLANVNAKLKIVGPVIDQEYSQKVFQASVSAVSRGN